VYTKKRSLREKRGENYNVDTMKTKENQKIIAILIREKEKCKRQAIEAKAEKNKQKKHRQRKEEGSDRGK
jgi:hypothetical protein